MAKKIICKSEKDWHKKRGLGIGGSDAAALLGLHPYCTAYELWESKIGITPHQKENNFMKMGKMLEPIVVKLFEENTGFQIENKKGFDEIYIHDKFPFARCTPDRTYITFEKQRELLSVKSHFAYNKIDVNDFPEYWFCQLQWEMGITGIHSGEIAWLERGIDFRYKHFDFVPEFFESMLSAADVFWNENVIGKNEPDPTVNDNLQRIFNKPFAGKTIDASNELFLLIGQYSIFRNLRMENKEAEENSLQEIKLIMRDAEAVTYDGQPICTWTGGTQRRFALKKGIFKTHSGDNDE